MRQRFLTAALRKLGPYYLHGLYIFQSVSALLITAGAAIILTVYIDFSREEFIGFVIFAESCTVVAAVLGIVRAKIVMQPIKRWLAGNRTDSDTVEAWRTAVAMPVDYILKGLPFPFIFVALPVTVFAYYQLNLTLFETLILFIGACGAVGYANVLYYFALELGTRPIVVKIAQSMPVGVEAEARRVVPLQWKLLAGLPVINILTGVIVASLSTQDQGGILGLGFDALIAVVVAFTISLELSIMLSRSILVPVHELVRATKKIAQGDLNVRVPVTSNDDVGELERSFNMMVSGMAERERLRQAFGTYVDPEVAERVMAEGEMLQGEEVEVTVLFADIKGFTEMTEESSPREVVKMLNGFYDCIVPILHRHGGYANKFVGDGLLAVFGAPERFVDHADRALQAAREIVSAVEERFSGEIRVGLGLNSGRVLSGSVGGGGRLEFTVIGDAVNVASRTERFTRETGDAVLLTASTYDLLRDKSRIEAREQVDMKGKAEPVVLYAAKWSRP